MNEQLEIPVESKPIRLPRFTGRYDSEDDLHFRRETLLLRRVFEPEFSIDIQKALDKTNRMLFELTQNPIYK